MKFKIYLVSLFFFLLNHFSYSQNLTPDKIVDVKIKTQNKISPGGIINADIILTIKKGWHINANKPFDNNLTPTVISLKDTSEIKIVKIIYPSPSLVKLQFSESQLSVYEDEAIIKLQLKIKKGLKKSSVNFRGEVQYQPCDNQTCLFPASKPFAFELNIKKLK